MTRPFVFFGRPEMRSLFAPAALALSTALAAGAAQLPNAAEHPAIAYSTSAPTDPVAQLQKRVDAGEVSLAYDEARGWLPAVLRALDIPTSSQTLVFSKTSLQLDRIAPWSPRALYFNDDVYVGWVQGGPIMELAAVDPKLGTVFYTISQDPSGPPRFEREGQTCLVCHDSSSVTGGVPGLIVRSVMPDRYGYGITPIGRSVTTDQTPIDERWGGWYVTGTHGGQQHMGNVIVPALAHEIGNVKSYLAKTPPPPAGNVTSLEDRFDTTAYLTEHSDLVALMVLSHQAYVHNLITVANYAARRGADDVAGAAEPLVRALFFARAAEWNGAMAGTSAFAQEFAARGPRDRKGRSLRDLDLQRRLFRYPLSYLIYSESFDALPAPARDYVYRRMREVLTGADPGKDFAHLTAADRQAILEIVRDTKPAFAATD
jgi:hypothetical protein